LLTVGQVEWRIKQKNRKPENSNFITDQIFCLRTQIAEWFARNSDSQIFRLKKKYTDVSLYGYMTVLCHSVPLNKKALIQLDKIIYSVTFVSGPRL
jgi:hypothetical protein